MVAQTQARNITVIINGTDYSQYLVELSIGFESWQMSKGLLRKTGAISLTSISGGATLDPRDNDDFQPGNVVAVNWNGGTHPLAGSLLVLSPPTIEPLLSDIPATTGNIVVNIPVGCALAYYEATEPDDDESGVTLGTGTPSATVIESLLTAAGVVDIGTIATGGFEFEYPIQKQGGGFVSMAGEVAHSCGPTGFLYCDNSNTVQGEILDIEGGSTISVVLGESDRDYLPQLDGSIPPGVVQAVGIRRRVTVPTDCTVTRYEEPERIKQEFEVCKYESRDVIIAAYDRLTINRDPIIYNQFFNARYIYSRESTEEYVTLYNSNGTVRGRYWKQTGLSNEWQVYGGDRLVLTVTERYDIRGNLSPDLTTASSDPNTYAYTMEHAETTVTRYEDQPDGTIKAISEEQWLPRVIVAPLDNTEPASANPWILVPAARKRTEWKREGTTWTERVSAVQARGIANPDFVESDAAPGLTYYDLITTEESGTRISSTGNTAPPRPDTWSPLPYEEEDQLESEARFSASRQRLVVQVPYAFTVAQMKDIAEVEGEVVWGRAYQYLVECEPNLFASQQSPMPIVRVRGAGENRIFMADAIQWQHTQSEDWVAFAGIYLGGSGGNSTIVGSFSRIGRIAPLILEPVGGAAIGTTPSGNPRTPLPLDGLVTVGATGYARIGVVAGYGVIG